MRKWKSSFLIAVMMVAALGQTATEMDSPQINRIAAQAEVQLRLQSEYGLR